jgi:hypothetical protein
MLLLLWWALSKRSPPTGIYVLWSIIGRIVMAPVWIFWTQ